MKLLIEAIKKLKTHDEKIEKNCPLKHHRFSPIKIHYYQD